MQSAPLRVSANGRYFVDVQGKPFFWLGDTAWPLLTGYTPEETALYLRRRAEEGFNVIKTGFAWTGGTFQEQAEPLPNYRGDRPWQNNNPATPNLPYFENVKQVLDIAAQHDVILSLLPTWGYFINDLKWFTPENAQVYGLWLGNYFKEYENIIWALGGDRDPRGYEDIHRAMAAGLREGHGGKHLMSYHGIGGTSSSRFFHDEDWLDFNIIQTWEAWHRIHAFVTADMLRTPIKPVVMDEGAYEAGPEYRTGPIIPLLVRKQAWLTFMAGGSHTYGHNDTWRMEPNWMNCLNSPGAQHMQQFKKIATSRQWWKMSPYQCLFLEGVGSDKTLNVAMRSEDCTCAMIYLSSQCHVLINLTELDSRQVRATWVSPINGEQKDAGIFETGNATGAIFPKATAQWFTTPPFWEDAILILDAI